MEKEEKLKNKRVGSITFGIMLIVFGITFFIQSVFKIDVAKYVSMFWPIIFILLGIEILYYNTKSDIIVKYDIKGTIFLFIIICFGMMIGFLDYCMNEIANNNDLKHININYECSDD
jgi:predicted membrane protein